MDVLKKARELVRTRGWEPGVWDHTGGEIGEKGEGREVPTGRGGDTSQHSLLSPGETTRPEEEWAREWIAKAGRCGPVQHLPAAVIAYGRRLGVTPIEDEGHDAYIRRLRRVVQEWNA